MTPSGIDKSTVTPDQLIELDADGNLLAGSGNPSAEFLLHATIYSELTGIGSVLHVHTVPNTILSRKHESAGKLVIEGFEMLKGLSGVGTHEHQEVIPVFSNHQDMRPLAEQLRQRLKQSPPIHGLLLAGHGLYTWGETLPDALRHLEALEFLFEVLYRSGEKE